MEDEAKPKKKRAPKSTAAEIELRVTVVIDLLLRGWSSQQIGRYASEKWDIVQRQAERYIQWASEKLTEQQERKRAHAFGLLVSGIEDMLRRERNKSPESGYDTRCELEIRKELHKLLGVYPADRQEVKVTGGLVSQLTDEELDRAIAAAEQDKKGDADDGVPGDPD